ncbi:hypothetical protein KIV10_06840 [Aequorivita echinoideorum]|uniref:Tissue inhibitor of metalloproteinase n=2 Tax=Aequorivita echinoideorum TaxID=1549647 RepID=A0ABS5S3V7_9FLAO|nr:hypothetical protein [Aequorivita echinoideorum]
MKQLQLLLIVLLMGCASGNAQEYSCQEIFEFVTENYDSRDNVSCIGSSMLVKANYYKVDGVGFVVGYFKSNDYDFTGEPYIFCGVSSTAWSNFKIYGISSWGKAFHTYIFDWKCDCY